MVLPEVPENDAIGLELLTTGELTNFWHFGSEVLSIDDFTGFTPNGISCWYNSNCPLSTVLHNSMIFRLREKLAE